MTIEVMDVVNAEYRTTSAANSQCEELLKRLGYSIRYLGARLAIARSLSRADAPEPVGGDEAMARGIRGLQMFGDGRDAGAWLALIVQRAGQQDLTVGEFRALVAAHWHRGAELLAKDWRDADEDLAAFVVRLAELANLPETPTGETKGIGKDDNVPDATEGEIVLPVGPVARDVDTGEQAVFRLNVSGGSPHMAIMGGTNSGKTYTAVSMLAQLHKQHAAPFLAFDFKGDLSERLADQIGADVVAPPRMPVPLNVLAVGRRDNIGIAEAASRIRESIGRVKGSRLGDMQADALRAAIQRALQAQTDGRPAEVEHVARALVTEYAEREQKPDGLIATLNEMTQFTLFEPTMPPSEFFSKRWIIRLPQDSTPEVRRFIVNLTLDSLDRWLNSLSDAPVVDGHQTIRHVCLLDEAHVILRTRLPALANLVRMSRSKGGVLMLVSQSPDDFEGQDEEFLDNMGLTVAFVTQARPGPVRHIFGGGRSLTALPPGEALCRIRAEARTRRIVAWKPDKAGDERRS